MQKTSLHKIQPQWHKQGLVSTGWSLNAKIGLQCRLYYCKEKNACSKKTKQNKKHSTCN